MRAKITECLLVLTFLLVLGSYWQLWTMRLAFVALGKQIERMDPAVPVEIGQMTRTQYWTSGGVPRSWPVTQGKTESDEDYTARCLSEWAEQLQQYPRD